MFKGFYGDGFTCLTQSSCKRDPGVCAREATCVPTGSNHYVCVCNDGYMGDGTNCKPKPSHEANFLLVNQEKTTHRIPFIPTNSNPGGPVYISHSQMAIALDIDCVNKRVYSSDIEG